MGFWEKVSVRLKSFTVSLPFFSSTWEADKRDPSQNAEDRELRRTILAGLVDLYHKEGHNAFLEADENFPGRTPDNVAAVGRAINRLLVEELIRGMRFEPHGTEGYTVKFQINRQRLRAVETEASS